MDKFRNKYRIKSHRKPNWDYSSNAMYYLTIVTQNRECNLGTIINGEMILSEFGKIVNTEWFESFEIRKELFLNEYVIMPNHIHAIVVLDNQNKIENVIETVSSDGTVETHGRASLQYHPTIRNRPAIRNPALIQNHPTYRLYRASLRHRAIFRLRRSSLQSNEPIPQIKRNPAIRLPKSISSFIAGFKSAVNTKVDDYIDENRLEIAKYNRNNHFFQPNYHDQIVRNNRGYLRIKNYIINNPKNWEDDSFNKDNNV